MIAINVLAAGAIIGLALGVLHLACVNVRLRKAYRHLADEITRLRAERDAAKRDLAALRQHNASGIDAAFQASLIKIAEWAKP
jgi:hypothetical protein